MEQYVLREPLGAVLASLATDISPLSSEKYGATLQSHSGGTMVEGSKVISLMKINV